MDEPKIIQDTYNLIKWFIPILNRMPRNHKFLLGDRIINNLYDILETLVKAKFSKTKLPLLESTNINLNIIHYQIRLLQDFTPIKSSEYESVSLQLSEIGKSLGGWINQQKQKELSS